MSLIPIEIVNKIILNAMQLRNLYLCEEIQRNVGVYHFAKNYYGKHWMESLSSAEEYYVANAPLVSDYKKDKYWRDAYRLWKKNNTDFVYRQKWPIEKSLTF